MERIIQGGTNTAIAAAAQMRSMVIMNPYSTSSGYGHSTASSYYLPVSTNNGISTNMSYVDYSHSISSAAATVQYAQAQHAQQQHRVATAAAASAYRPTHHHHAKVMNPTQAAVYQQAYQQYQQFLQRHGMHHSHQQHHQHQNAQGVIHQRMLGMNGMPIMSSNGTPSGQTMQQQPRLVPFINRNSQTLQQQPPQQLYHHTYSNSHSHIMPGSNPQPPQLLQHGHTDGSQRMGYVENAMMYSGNLDNKEVLESCRIKAQKISLKTSKESISKHQRASHTSSRERTSSALSEKTVKLKSTKPCKIREKRPRLVVGRTKKSTGNSNSCNKKRRSSQKSNTSSANIGMQNFPPLLKVEDSKEKVGTAKRRKAEDDDIMSVLNVSNSDEAAEFTDVCSTDRINCLKAVKPPPGFEHLMRPSFPIEQYDPSLLGNLMGGQLPHEAVSLIDGMAIGDMDNALMTNLCCEDHAVASLKKSSHAKCAPQEQHEEDEWESLEKDIKNALDDWTEELALRKKIQRILCRMNLNNLFVKSCLISEIDLEENSEDDNCITSKGTASPQQMQNISSNTSQEQSSD